MPEASHNELLEAIEANQHRLEAAADHAAENASKLGRLEGRVVASATSMKWVLVVAVLFLVSAVAGQLVVLRSLSETIDRESQIIERQQENTARLEALLQSVRPPLARYEPSTLVVVESTRASIHLEDFVVCFPSFVDSVTLTNGGAWRFVPRTPRPPQASSDFYRTTSNTKLARAPLDNELVLSPSATTDENCATFNDLSLPLPDRLQSDLAFAPSWSPTMQLEFLVEPEAVVEGAELAGGLAQLRTESFTIPPRE